MLEVIESCNSLKFYFYKQSKTYARIIRFAYVFQACSGDNRNVILLDILSRFTDNSLLPVFCQALVETGQVQVAQMLGYTG